MKPRVNIYPNKDRKGDSKVLIDEGKHSLLEAFTQSELVGRTFYLIHPVKKNGQEFALDNGGTNKQGGVFHLWTWSKDNMNQIFTMLPNGVIKCVGNTMVMDVINGNFTNGTQLHNYAQNNSDAQLWTYDSNTKLLRLKNKPFVLNIHNYDVKDGGVLNIWEPNGHESQTWDVRLCEVKEGYYVNALRVSYRENYSLNHQAESFQTSRCIIYEHTNGGGYRSKTLSIGDYNNITAIEKEGFYPGPSNNIGSFAEWIGKVIMIRTRDCTNKVVDSRGSQRGDGGDKGQSKIGIWEYDPKNTLNQQWVIDDHGRITLAANQDWCIYAKSMNNSTPITLVKISTLDQKDMKQYWTYNGNSITNLGGDKRAFDMDMAKPCTDGDEIHIYTSDGRHNQLWNLSEAQSINYDIGKFKNWIDKKFILRSGANKSYAIDHWGIQTNPPRQSFKIYQADPKNENQTFTVDKDGRLYQYTNRDMVLYTSGTRDYTTAIFIPRSDPRANSVMAKWCLDTSDRIVPINQRNRGLDVEGGKMANDVRVIIWGVHDGGNQKWYPEDVTPPPSDIGDFKQWVGKRFVIACKQNTQYVWDERSFHKNKQGNDQGYLNIWRRDGSRNQAWTIDSEGHLTLWHDKTAMLGGGDGKHGGYPKMVNNDNGQHNGNKWRYYKGSICYLNGLPFLHASGAKMNDGTRIGLWTDENARSQSNCQWILEEVAAPTEHGNILDDDISSIRLYPFTDVFVYENRNFTGKLLHIHNGQGKEWLVNLTDHAFNDQCSSIKVRAALIDDKQSVDKSDTSGNANCSIRYKTHLANVGWTNWVTNGQESGSHGKQIQAIMFEYSGPGQMLARAHVANKGWLPWVTSGEVCGTTGESRQMEAIEFKIDGATNVFFGCDVSCKGIDWQTNVGLNKTAGTTGQSRQMEVIRVTVSLSEIKATTPSPRAKVINLVNIPSDWVVTDMSIGKFNSLIGKPFVIKSRGNSKFLIDSDGKQNGGGLIKLYERASNFHVNQTWTVDKEGHIISWQNRNSILYVETTRNGVRPLIIGMNGNDVKTNSSQSKWRLNDDNVIESLSNPNQVLDISGANYANNSVVHLWAKHNGNNQKWDIEILEQKTNLALSKETNLVGKKFYLVHDRTDANGKMYAFDNRGKVVAGTEFYMYEWTKGNANQLFTINEQGQIKCINGNMVLDVQNGKIENGSKLIEWTPHDGANQQWGYDVQRHNLYINSNKSFCVNAPIDSIKNTGSVRLYNCGDCQESKFWIVFEDGSAFNQNFVPKTDVTNDIGKFGELVGKNLRISCKACAKLTMDSLNTQIIMNPARNASKDTQEWQVDKDGHIMLASNKDLCVYTTSINNSTKLTLIKASTLSKYDMKQYWTYDGTFIRNIGGKDIVFDLPISKIDESLCQNGLNIHVYQKHGNTNQQWNVIESTPIIEYSPVGSMEISPMTDVIVYEEALDKNVKPKKITFHNGARVRRNLSEAEQAKLIYVIDDMSVFGLKSIKNVELKVAKADGKQTTDIAEYESFTFGFDGEDRIISIIIVVVAVVIALGVIGALLWVYIPKWKNKGSDDESDYGNNVKNNNGNDDIGYIYDIEY